MKRSSNRSIKHTYNVWCTLIIELRENPHTIHNSHTASAFCCGKLLRRFKTCVHETTFNILQQCKEKKRKTAVNYSLIASTMSWELSAENSTHTPPLHCSKFHSCHSPSSSQVQCLKYWNFHFPLFASNFTPFLWRRRAIKKKFIKLFLHRTNKRDGRMGCRGRLKYIAWTFNFFSIQLQKSWAEELKVKLSHCSQLLGGGCSGNCETLNCATIVVSGVWEARKWNNNMKTFVVFPPAHYYFLRARSNGKIMFPSMHNFYFPPLLYIFLQDLTRLLLIVAPSTFAFCVETWIYPHLFCYVCNRVCAVFILSGNACLIFH